MKTKREVLETFEEDGACIGIHCKECPFYQGIHEGCDMKCYHKSTVAKDPRIK